MAGESRLIWVVGRPVLVIAGSIMKTVSNAVALTDIDVEVAAAALAEQAARLIAAMPLPTACGVVQALQELAARHRHDAGPPSGPPPTYRVTRLVEPSDWPPLRLVH